MKKLILFSMALLFSVAVFSQRNDNSEYWNVWEYKVKDGMEQKFTDAAAKKTAKFNGTPESAIITYRTTTGRSAGNLVRVQANRKPADYDVDRTAEGKYWRDNVSEFVGSSYGLVIWQRLKDGSYNFEPGEAPAKFVQRTFVEVKADRTGHFRRFRSRIAKVMEKRKYNGRVGLFRVESGGNRNLFGVTMAFDTYKQAAQPEHETSFQDDYNEMFGWGTFEEDVDNYDKSIEIFGERRETMQLVPEMSSGMMK